MERLFAVVDIETTGGHASAHGLTEIAIVVFDGGKIVETFESLINPQQDIPLFIQSLTGITPQMTATAPLFSEVSEKIYNLLNGKIFVAHNVNFDYSFVAHHLKMAGYQLNSKKLCSVRLARKVLPGHPSYSLGKLCSSLQIPISNRHRAMGDALATTELLKRIITADDLDEIGKSLKANSKEQILPPHLKKEDVMRLPHHPGVYYFKDRSGKVIYVGKAINIFKRVCSHFANNHTGKKKQSFLREIHSISYELCGTELQALILETLEIKRLWPAYNRALKNPEGKFGLYVYENQNGLLQLAVGKKMKFLKPFLSISSLAEGYKVLRQLSEEFSLCPRLSYLQDNQSDCLRVKEGQCDGACRNADTYNQKVKEALQSLKSALRTYMVVQEGRNMDEKCCIIMEEGSFYGMGFLETGQLSEKLSVMKEKIVPSPSYQYIHHLIESHVVQHPAQVNLLN